MSFRIVKLDSRVSFHDKPSKQSIVLAFSQTHIFAYLKVANGLTLLQSKPARAHTGILDGR